MKTRILRNVLLVCLALGLAGCLQFGDDLDLEGDEIAAEHLQTVTSLTGIEFPDGSVPRGFYYLGSGIDDALALKLMIPDDGRQRFQSNKIFEEGVAEVPGIEIGRGKRWWSPERLEDRRDRTMQLPDNKYLGCSFGREDGGWVVYISWSEM